MDAGLPVDIGALNSARTAERAQDLAGRKEDAGEQMEALFATMLVKELRKALPNEGFFGPGKGADVFNGWMDEFLGEQLARDGALDLAGRVKVALEEQERKNA
jgi:Rod binding domain-containing protein